jgi:hypothetical protein
MTVGRAGEESLMAAETVGNASVGTYVFMLLLGLAWAAWPLAVVTNFRGYRDGHLRRTLRGQERLRRLPPYRWRKTDPETDRKFGTTMQLLVATVFLLAAVALVVTAAVGLVRQSVQG